MDYAFNKLNPLVFVLTCLKLKSEVCVCLFWQGLDDSVRLMEDRLQELNRQSAAARAKLLELIDQQRQTTSHSASPSISPIPLQSTGPHTGMCVFHSSRFTSFFYYNK